MAAGKTNMKRLTSHIFRIHVLRGLLVGAILGIVVLLSGFGTGLDYMQNGLIIIAVLAVLIGLILGLLIGAIASASFKGTITKQEKTAEMTFNADTLQPADAQHKVYLGEDWLVHRKGNGFKVFAKESVSMAEGPETVNPNARTKWLRIRPVSGIPYIISYKNEGEDLLESVNRWLGVEPEKEEESTEYPPGTCMRCLGPNEPGAAECQWCGSKMYEAPKFNEPETAAAPENEPVRTVVPEESKGNGKGTWITIVLLTLVLAGLLAYMYLL